MPAIEVRRNKKDKRSILVGVKFSIPPWRLCYDDDVVVFFRVKVDYARLIRKPNSLGIRFSFVGLLMSRVSKTILSMSFWLVMGVLVSDGLLTYVNLRTIVENNARVDHTREVVIELEHTLSVLKDAETGQRGYLLTSKARYLDPYRAAALELDRTLSRLAALTSDNPFQRDRIVELRRVIAEKMAELAQSVTVHDKKDLAAALEVVQTDRGERLMTEARQVVAAMEAEENRLLGLRTAATQTATRRTLFAFIVVTSLVVGLLVAVFYLNRRETRYSERISHAIREERGWLSTTLNSIGDAVIATDSEGRIKFLNPVAEALTGWSQAEAIGRWVVEVFPIQNEYTREKVEDPIGKVLRDGGVVGLANHTVLIARDGTETPIEDSAAPIKDERGETIGVVMVFRDATVQRRYEEALRASEREFRQLADAMPQIVWTARRDGVLDYYNARWYEFTGSPRGEEGDSSWEPILHPDDVSMCREVWYHSVGTGEPYEIEYRFLDRQTGEYRWHLGRALPARDDAGTIVKWYGTGTDINDQKQVEQALRKSHVMIADILDHMADACIGIDRNWRYTYVNAQWEKAFGKGASEVLGKVIWDLFPHLVGSNIEKNYRKAAEHRVGVSFETFSPVLDRWLLVRAYPTEQGIASFIQDIDDRKRADDELRIAKEEAEFASQAKDRFLAILSHELRTPLNPVLLATTAMLEQTTPPDEIRPTLEMIRQNVDLQARLIDDLLDVMRIVRGKLPLHWNVVDCHDQIRRAIEICNSEIQNKNLHLVLRLSAEHCHVNADPARLQQVLWNLIKNAVKFTPPKGMITIASRNEGGRDDRAGTFVIEVADTGIGIEPDVLPTIFDPFQQGETTITRRFGGLGLGLAIGRGIIEAHGGTLSGESQGEGQGATFRIELRTVDEPQLATRDQPREPVREQPPNGKPCQILVVEDEPATLHLMARLLGRLGHEVKTAATVGAALEVLHNGGFDLLISDIGLPDGSGLDLIRQVVAEKGPVPSIALTGYGMDEDIRRSRDAGFTLHMTKPIDFTKLVAMIRQITV